MLRQAILLLLGCSVYQVAANNCMCGIFVMTMFPGLSRIDPLNYAAMGSITDPCDLIACRDYCASQGPNYDYSLSIMQDGQPRRNRYCEQIDELYGGGTNIAVENEVQTIQVRLPDCGGGLNLWDTEKVYRAESSDRLCCNGATPC